MDIATIVGLVVGFVSIAVAAASGGGIKGFLDPMSAVLVLGGAFSALLVNYPLNRILQAFRNGTQVFRSESFSPEDLATTLVDMSSKARRQGILALEDDLEELPPGLLRRGVEKVIDGVTPEDLREALEAELEIEQERRDESKAIFDALGTYAPAFGMIGTIVGLIKMAATLDDPSSLGPALALALVTTFYGALVANLVFLPIAGKLKVHADAEFSIGNMIIKGITAISSGANPRAVEEMMDIYVGKKKAESEEDQAAEGEPDALEAGA